MNLILLEKDELALPLPITDPRAIHILTTLRRRKGDSFDAGVVNGLKGKGRLLEIGEESLWIDYELNETPPPLYPVGLLAGLPRPQTARKILQECGSLGIVEIHFASTARCEPSYMESRLWTTGEYRRHLIAGAAQAFTTLIPEIGLHDSIETALKALLPRYAALALDNYEASGPMRSHPPPALPCLLIVGPERGWTKAERDLFRSHKIPILGLGRNVLRTETASLCGLTLLLAALEFL